MKYNITNLFYRFSFIVIFMSTLQLSAQDSDVIRGQVLDVASQQPLPGATVIEQDAENRTITGVVTDFDGNFAILVKNTSNKLVISSMGFTTQTLTIGSKRNFVVNMVENIEGLEEIVISATKTAESGLLNIAARDLTTSAVTISAADVENTQAASIDEALQGRSAGVDITANSG